MTRILRDARQFSNKFFRLRSGPSLPMDILERSRYRGLAGYWLLRNVVRRGSCVTSNAGPHGDTPTRARGEAKARGAYCCCVRSPQRMAVGSASGPIPRFGCQKFVARFGQPGRRFAGAAGPVKWVLPAAHCHPNQPAVSRRPWCRLQPGLWDPKMCVGRRRDAAWQGSGVGLLHHVKSAQRGPFSMWCAHRRACTGRAYRPSGISLCGT
jgi:hypothetical protein